MNPIFRAALWMLGAITCFSTMAVAGREVSLDHDTFEVMFYRSCVGILIVVSVVTATRRWGEIGPAQLGLHFVRNVSHFTGQNLWFYAVGVIPLAQVFALEFTAPLWVLLMSPIFLGERITPPRAFAAFVGFVGILVVTRPFAVELGPGVLAALGAAIGFAGSAVFTRKLTRTQTLACILFFLTTMQAVFGLVLATVDGEMALPSAQSAPWLVIIGIAGLAAHFCLTTALKLAPATVIMPVDFARLPVIALIGWVLYQERLELAVILGGALILTANWINIRASVREARVPARAPGLP
ncbi:DMT family transporter [Maritimibacter sp. UBA3975]|uniref:DMT family transporter n=1 Tax=Maritimibacter sp. UBA3975 TaxID=1946833 RepID=UPI000C092C8D|nr:DMT family transporter [Maritimibacter sp. UBA3975]MAM60539.1 EamA family transporter [Maritimibacter sp.]|tara:strand:- start:20009 stop:20899 length:891 start_codon:yes stop_codon:yes gene_type:complete